MLKFSFILLYLVAIMGCKSTTESHEDEFNNSGHQEFLLNGKWKFTIDTTLINSENWHANNFNLQDWDELIVPGNWDTENEYANYVGTGIYRKSFNIPKEWSGSTVRLHFGAVYQSAEVWLNETYLGKHIGGYTPFEFDISKILKTRGMNVLILTVNNSYGRGAWWHWGGISREVKLIRNNHTFIKHVHVTTDPDLTEGSAGIISSVHIENKSSKQVNGRIITEIQKFDDDQQSPIRFETPFGIQGDDSKKIELIGHMEAKDVELWDVENPVLYSIKTTLLAEDSCVIHSHASRFGIREIRTLGTSVLLNGKEIHFHGFNRVADHRAYGQTEPDELVKFDIDAMKAMGCNFTRIMHYPQSPNLLDYCDEVGMLLIEEIPVWGKGDPNLHPHNPMAKQWLKEMIERDYNHPSIIGWSVGNEICDETLEGRQMSPRIYAYVETMIDFIKTLDTTRLKTYVSFTVGKTTKKGVDPADICDIICFTSYGNASKVAERCHKVWPDKPIFVAEIGKNQLNKLPGKAVLASSLKRAIEMSEALDYVVGVSLWTYNDYRSNYRGTPPGQERTWGVYNVWRQPKKAAYEIREIYKDGPDDENLPVMADPPSIFSDDRPEILAVIPLENSCMIGFTVANDEDDYEIEYANQNGKTKSLEISGLSGAAKINNMMYGDYKIRMRKISSTLKSDWSASIAVTIKDNRK